MIKDTNICSVSITSAEIGQQVCLIQTLRLIQEIQNNGVKV